MVATGWRLRSNTSDHAAGRSFEAPAPTMLFGARLNKVTRERDSS